MSRGRGFLVALLGMTLFGSVWAAGAPEPALPSSSRRLAVVTSDGWDSVGASLRRFERRGKRWRPVGRPVPVILGRSGLGWGRGLHAAGLAGALGGPAKQEGDGRSPAGVFRLSEATGYATAAPPGTTLAYRQATSRLRCVDDPGSEHYNRLTLAPEKDPPAWASDEAMRRDDELYALTVVVEHNRAPVQPGGGSCIFLHVWRGPELPTVGCTAMDLRVLEALLPWLARRDDPLLVQLPLPVYQRVAASWGLPPLPGRP